MACERTNASAGWTHDHHHRHHHHHPRDRTSDGGDREVDGGHGRAVEEEAVMDYRNKGEQVGSLVWIDHRGFENGFEVVIDGHGVRMTVNHEDAEMTPEQARFLSRLLRDAAAIAISKPGF